MSRMIVGLALGGVIAVLALGGAACSNASSATPTGCVATRPDAGTIEAGLGAECRVGWSCNSDSQHYYIDCSLEGGNYSCACTSDTSALAKTILINAFSCDLKGGALPAAAQCGWMLQM